MNPIVLPPSTHGTAVFIVGAGPTGLATALLMDRFEIPFVVVERNAGLTDHPRARGTWVRTMELFRQWGIERQVKARGLPDDANGFAFVESIAGDEIGRVPREIDYGQTPAWKCTVSQDAVEDELYQAVRGSKWGKVLFETEFVRYEERGDGVQVVTRDVGTEAQTTWTAAYLVAADGAGSSVRRMMDIQMNGPASLALMNNDFWEGDLSHIPSVRQVGVFRVMPGDRSVPGGAVLNTNGADRWLTVTRVGDGNEAMPPMRSDEEVVKLARAHSGVPNLDVKIISRSAWRVSKQVAERYARGRAFLVGDAAHRFPPTGGYGMNTGIQDAHNLAWKLSMVLRGQAGSALLDSYDSERRPIGQANADFSHGNTMRFVQLEEAYRAKNLQAIEFWIKDTFHHSHSIGLGLGFSYEDGAVIPDGTAPRGLTLSRYDPTDRPGARFPHFWLDLARQHSTLDLFDRDFVLVHGPQSADWAAVARDVGGRLGVRVATHQLPSVDSRDGLDMGLHGAVLVRPDGHVAWRMPWVPTDPSGELGKALTRILRRPESVA
ncbi:FAD-dependent monooxygenase [Variovorax sp. OV329]|uniref:FAD-dependent monooxygenase n=1 Tax=Variovorax sp. OV329 TaxID=1882825 RepID=UPI0008E35C86|nr:FAD-dependent monooxygenase [Variovorax sp. OV329]SFM92639.1 2,4-dichlorophenol 6-monooxygenase/putative polyketide hydroxylase [Variovorax sp. OV329]